MEWFFWIGLLISFLIVTYLFKSFLNAKTWFIFSMVRSERLAKLLDRFSSKWFWDFISVSGIFLGFGFAGIYYWYRTHNKKWRYILFWQAILFVVSLAIVSLMFGAYSNFNLIMLVIVTNLFGLAGFSIYILGIHAVEILANYFVGKNSCPGVAPVIPGVEIPGVPISIPFLSGWLSLFIIMVLHELAHGVLARHIGVRVKSFGLLLLGFFPIGAFTEPDEQELVKSKPRDQLKVYAAGPMINFYLTVFVLILSIIFASLTNSYLVTEQAGFTDGLYLAEVTEFTGLCGEGPKSLNYGLLDTNVKILYLNGVEINDYNSFYYALSLDSISAKLLLEGNEGIYLEELYFNSDGKLGITVELREKADIIKPFKYSFYMFISELLRWLWILSLMVAIFNFLPSEPFDGGKMAKIILGSFIMKRFAEKKKRRLIGLFFGSLVLLFLIINLLPLFF